MLRLWGMVAAAGGAMASGVLMGYAAAGGYHADGDLWIGIAVWAFVCMPGTILNLTAKA